MEKLTITTYPGNKLVQKIELEMSGEFPVWFGYLYFNGESYTLFQHADGKFTIEKSK